MFDWPEQIQTSPTSTSSNLRVFLPSMVSVCGPPAGIGIEHDLPGAVGAGLGRVALPADLDRDILARLGPAPDPIFLIALQDHVRSEDCR